jgi:hypothetical protein
LDKDIVGEDNPNLPKFTFKATDKLPSRAMPYPKGASIDYRSYTFGEIEELANSSISSVEKFQYILRGVKTNFDTLSLTVPDVLMIGLLRKVFTIGGEEFRVGTQCPACGKAHTMMFHTAPEVGKELENVIDFEYLDVPALPVKVTFSFGEHIFYPMTISDFLYLVDKGYIVNKLTSLAVQCHSLDFPESIDIFGNVDNAQDILKLNRVNKLLGHHVKPLHMVCDNILTANNGDLVPCGENLWIDLTNSAQSVILPFRSPDDAIEDSFHFGE